MMLSLNQFVLRCVTNGAVQIRYYPVTTKMAQSLFAEEKLPVVKVGRLMDGW